MGCQFTALAGAQVAVGRSAIDASVSTDAAAFTGDARLNDTQIQTQSGANLAIARIDNAMSRVDQELATYGSVMNRLSFAADNALNVALQTQNSRSRVLDTDYAATTSELARTQIIQQAGMAMLTQANQAPGAVLKLLR